jgi:hypothetical protein
MTTAETKLGKMYESEYKEWVQAHEFYGQNNGEGYYTISLETNGESSIQ